MNHYTNKHKELEGIRQTIKQEGKYTKKTSKSSAQRLAGRFRQYCNDMYGERSSYNYSPANYRVTLTIKDTK